MKSLLVTFAIWKNFLSRSVHVSTISAQRRYTEAPLMPMIRAPDAPILVDKRFQVSVDHLTPFQPCTIRAELRTEKDEIFESYGHYIADSSGKVNLERDSSFGGTYVGSDCMGLFWSMLPAPGQRKGLRYTASNLQVPMKFNLQLYDSHFHFQSCDGGERNILDSKIVMRTYLSPNVERIEIHNGSVIDTFGSHGGLLEYRAALLASYGFTVFALAFFNYKDLPSKLEDVELEYFLEAIDWLSEHERVCEGGIGYIGTSYGGQFALQAAVERRKIKAITTISSPVHDYQNIKFKGKLIGFERKFTISDCETIDGVLVPKSLSDPYQDEVAKHAIEVEKIQGKILSITGEDDMCYRCSKDAHMMKGRIFEKTGRRTIHTYNVCGHWAFD